MKKLLFLITLSGCASAPKSCPSIAEEPVSMCRAEVACAPSFGQRMGVAMSGANARHTSTLVTLKRESCMTNHIEAQKANAALKLMGSIQGEK